MIETILNETHPLIVGYTGTQVGMNNTQISWVFGFLKDTKPRIEEAHHGCCIGGDLNFNNICLILYIPLILHPPEDFKKVDERVFVGIPKENVRKRKPYLNRNHDIVDECNLLIATPKSEKEQLRSGTWATIRYAKKTLTDTIIIYPSGEVEVFC